MCHGVGHDGCMINLTKASNILFALFVLHGARARVCVWGAMRQRKLGSHTPPCHRRMCVWGGGDAIVMRQQGTPSQMVRFISPNPNPVTISP